MTRKTQKESRLPRGPFPFHGGPMDGSTLTMERPPKIYIARKLTDEGDYMAHVYQRHYHTAEPKPGELLSTETTITYVYDPDATRKANEKDSAPH